MLFPQYSSQPFAATLLPAGHKIGKPLPLFTKLEQSRIDELRKKYGGAQDNGGAKKADDKKVFSTIIEAEEAIKVQGDKVLVFLLHPFHDLSYLRF